MSFPRVWEIIYKHEKQVIGERRLKQSVTTPKGFRTQTFINTLLSIIARVHFFLLFVANEVRNTDDFSIFDLEVVLILGHGRCEESVEGF